MNGVPPEVAVYLAAVRAALADLPPEERDDLLTDVRASLAVPALPLSTPVWRVAATRV